MVFLMSRFALFGTRLWRQSLGFILVSIWLMPTQAAWNNPYPSGWTEENTLFSAFSAPPKTLDPVKSYSSNEWVFLANIVEPPLQYHYLKRPYTLEPLILTQMPVVTYDAQTDTSRYLLTLKPNIYYAPHDAFSGQQRAVTATDLAYAIARLADRSLGSPIVDMMHSLIVGLSDTTTTLAALPKASEWRDYRQYLPSGVQVIDEHQLSIDIHGRYPSFIYWLAMPFFAPIPWEVDAAYAQPGMAERNIGWGWQPVGTGAYYLAENNPNRRMVLERNPYFHDEVYPHEKGAELPESLLSDAGQTLPMVERVVFALEKEAVPYWGKFLQGYYDASGIASEVFDQAVQLDPEGKLSLTTEMRAKNLQLLSSVATSSFYMGFNMNDPLIGQANPNATYLRQAISIAMDYEEQIAIFLNGRGVAAQGPIPPGIAGASEDCNPITHITNAEGVCDRRPLSDAKALMVKAGYENGIDPSTGQALVLYYDTASSVTEDKAQLDWMRKQFAKLGIQLVIRATDYNRFQEKMLAGNAQIFTWGWNADYPDAENFLFLLAGSNAKMDKGGENASNYHNAEFDRLFEQIARMEDSSDRRELIQQAVAIARHDAPWVFGLHPQSVSLFHGWVGNVYPNLMANNTLKYRRIDVAQRHQAQQAWNHPMLWPLAIALVLLFALAALVWRQIRLHSR